MGQYNIKELEQLSGIKAHTIRIWEKRYNLFSPLRTSTNIRVYSDQDLKKLLNVSMLYQSGMKISKIAALPDNGIEAEITHLSTTKKNGQIEKLIQAMIDLDETLFDKTINTCVLQNGFEYTVLSVIYPFLKKIGILWISEQILPAQEHFISHLIRQKLIVAIDGLVPKNNKRPKNIILFLPEGEMHELPLLFYHYLVKKAGHKYYYLGSHVPNTDIISICQQDLMKKFIGISILTVKPSKSTFNRYFQAIIDNTSNIELLLAGQIPTSAKPIKEVTYLADLHQLKSYLNA